MDLGTCGVVGCNSFNGALSRPCQTLRPRMQARTYTHARPHSQARAHTHTLTCTHARTNTHLQELRHDVWRQPFGHLKTGGKRERHTRASGICSVLSQRLVVHSIFSIFLTRQRVHTSSSSTCTRACTHRLMVTLPQSRGHHA